MFRLCKTGCTKRYAITPSPGSWPQWLIDIINKFHRKPETIFCTLFHFPLHDFHLNSIIHNKWPRALLLPSPDKQRIIRHHWPAHLRTFRTDSQVWNSRLCILFFLSSVAVCWDSEKWLHVNYIQPKNVIGHSYHWALLISRYIQHRSKRWQKQCLLCNWNRLLLLFCSGFFARVTRANDCVYNENAERTAQQYFKHTTLPEWWKTVPASERKHKLLLIIYPARSERAHSTHR